MCGSIPVCLHFHYQEEEEVYFYNPLFLFPWSHKQNSNISDDNLYKGGKFEILMIFK